MALQNLFTTGLPGVAPQAQTNGGVPGLWQDGVNRSQTSMTGEQARNVTNRDSAMLGFNGDINAFRRNLDPQAWDAAAKPGQDLTNYWKSNAGQGALYGQDANWVQQNPGAAANMAPSMQTLNQQRSQQMMPGFVTGAGPMGAAQGMDPSRRAAIQAAFNDPNNTPQSISQSMRDWGVTNEEVQVAKGWDQNQFNNYFDPVFHQGDPMARSARQTVPGAMDQIASSEPTTNTVAPQSPSGYNTGVAPNGPGSNLSPDVVNSIHDIAFQTPTTGSGWDGNDFSAKNTDWSDKDGNTYHLNYTTNGGNAGGMDNQAQKVPTAIMKDVIPGHNKVGDEQDMYDLAGNYLGRAKIPKDNSDLEMGLVVAAMTGAAFLTASSIAGAGAATAAGGATATPVAGATATGTALPPLGSTAAAGTAAAGATGIGSGASIAAKAIPALASMAGGAGGGGGSSSTGAGTGGSFLNNIAGLVSGGVDASEQQKATQAYQGWLKEQQAKIDNLYSPGSPEYNYLMQEMARKDAAAGRNSQYGPRSVELGARIAQIKADATTRFTTGVAPSYQASLNQAAARWSGLSAAAQKAIADQLGTTVQNLTSLLQGSNSGGGAPGTVPGGYTGEDGTRYNNPSAYTAPSAPDYQYDPTTDPEYGGGDLMNWYE